MFFHRFSFASLPTDKVSQTRRCCSKLFWNTKIFFRSGSMMSMVVLNSRENQQLRKHKNCCKISSYNFLLNRERGKLLENVFPLFHQHKCTSTRRSERKYSFFFLLLFFQIANRFFLLFLLSSCRLSNFKFDGTSNFPCWFFAANDFFRCHCTFTGLIKFNQK